MTLPQQHDVIVLGAGAAGLMCARVAARRGRRVLVLERNARPGLKILVSGGGRCNFTNRRVGAENFHTGNADFPRSALARFGPEDFLQLVEAHGLPFHERKWGQLFCDDSAKRILGLLLDECEQAGVELRTGCEVQSVRQLGGPELDVAVPASEGPTSSEAPRFQVNVTGGTAGAGGAAGRQEFTCSSLVVATGGLAWPRLGVSDFGYRLARQFGLPLVPSRPGLVPLLWSGPDRARYGPLAGIAVFARVRCAGASFLENVLFTHDGLSGPAILQISNVWRPGSELSIDWRPDEDLLAALRARKSAGSAAGGAMSLRNVLAESLPRRFIDVLLEGAAAGVGAGAAAPRLVVAAERPIGQCADQDLVAAARLLSDWRTRPAADAGYAKAEVTLGGVDTRALSSRTLEARDVPGLHFIGEVVDVTGWLGGFNFQWAWASGAAAGEAV